MLAHPGYVGEYIQASVPDFNFMHHRLNLFEICHVADSAHDITTSCCGQLVAPLLKCSGSVSHLAAHDLCIATDVADAHACTVAKQLFRHSSADGPGSACHDGNWRCPAIILFLFFIFWGGERICPSIRNGVTTARERARSALPAVPKSSHTRRAPTSRLLHLLSKHW